MPKKYRQMSRGKPRLLTSTAISDDGRATKRAQRKIRKKNGTVLIRTRVRDSSGVISAWQTFGANC